MAKLTDPDDLNRDTEVIFNTTNSTIQLVVTGNLSTDGATLQCIYSFCREQWKSQADLIPYPFPLEPIDGPAGTQFLLTKGWTWLDTTTTGLIKDGGWAQIDSLGVSEEEWMNITSLGAFNAATDQAYYNQTGTTITDVTLDGEVNQAIKIYGDAGNGDFDYRDKFDIYLRIEGKKYAEYDLIAEQNISALTYKKYSLPLVNSSDSLKITHTDGEVASAPYTNIDMTYVAASSRNVGGSSYDFDYIWEGDSKTLEQIYEKQMYLLRQSGDIDEGGGTAIGQLQSGLFGQMMKFEGDTLHVEGYIDNYLSADSARVVFYDNGGIARTPTVNNSFKFTLNPSVTGYEWRIYEVTAIGSLVGANEVAGEESAVSDNQEYSYVHSVDQPIAVQIIDLSNDYVENTSYYTLTASNQDVIINMSTDANN